MSKVVIRQIKVISEMGSAGYSDKARKTTNMSCS